MSQSTVPSCTARSPGCRTLPNSPTNVRCRPDHDPQAWRVDFGGRVNGRSTDWCSIRRSLNAQISVMPNKSLAPTTWPAACGHMICFFATATVGSPNSKRGRRRLRPTDLDWPTMRCRSRPHPVVSRKRGTSHLRPAAGDLVALWGSGHDAYLPGRRLAQSHRPPPIRISPGNAGRF